GAGTKIDNLVQVGHNCRIGEHNLLCGLVGIAGSCTTGDYVVLAGGAGIADHVNIGDRAVVGARAGVGSDLEAGVRYHGSPALARLCGRFHWSGVARLGRMIRLFAGDGVSQVVMAGKVHKADVLYRPWRLLHLLPDWRTVKVYYLRSRADNRDDTLLLTLIQ